MDSGDVPAESHEGEMAVENRKEPAVMQLRGNLNGLQPERAWRKMRPSTARRTVGRRGLCL
jgi:hypothetical protein